MRTYYIYKATNKLNGMSYMGRTVNFDKRRKEHEACNPREDCEFHRAIQKYGKDNFDWKIIDIAFSEEEGNELEKKYIKEYNTLIPNGYNMTIGGFNNPITNYKPVVCLELDGTYVRRYNGIDEALRDGYVGVKDCCERQHRQTKGKQFMYESDYLSSGTKVYVKAESTSMKPIVQCDIHGNVIKHYKSVTQASKETGIRRATISGAITGAYKLAGGYIWVYEEELQNINVSDHVHRKKGRKVAQVDAKTGEIIKVFDRIADAGRELGVNYKAIHKVVDMPDRTAYGFKWISQ